MNDALKDILPPKREMILFTGLTDMQKKCLKTIICDNSNEILNQCTKQHFLRLIVQLKQICNHAFLIPTIQQDENNDVNIDGLIHNSSKILVLNQILPKLQRYGHKVVICTQMIRMLDIIENYLNFFDYNYERVDGSTAYENRERAMNNFHQNRDSFIFLVSSRVGVGIDLSCANTMILFDNDTNPNQDKNTISSCYRIGQRNPISIIRLVTRHSIEELYLRGIYENIQPLDFFKNENYRPVFEYIIHCIQQIFDIEYPENNITEEDIESIINPTIHSIDEIQTNISEYNNNTCSTLPLDGIEVYGICKGIQPKGIQNVIDFFNKFIVSDDFN